MEREAWFDKDDLEFSQTLNLKKMIGAPVLSMRGTKLGHITEVRTHPTTLASEGIVVSRGLFEKPVYFSKTYIERFSLRAVVLSIEPVYLLKGKRVIRGDGKIVGTVKSIVRGRAVISGTVAAKSIVMAGTIAPSRCMAHVNVLLKV